MFGYNDGSNSLHRKIVANFLSSLIFVKRKEDDFIFVVKGINYSNKNVMLEPAGGGRVFEVSSHDINEGYVMHLNNKNINNIIPNQQKQ